MKVFAILLWLAGAMYTFGLYHQATDNPATWNSITASLLFWPVYHGMVANE